MTILNDEDSIGIIWQSLDATELAPNTEPTDITELISLVTKAKAPIPSVCIAPPFVPLAVKGLCNTATRVGTVINFPKGQDSVATCIEAIERVYQQGAREIDYVFPYSLFLAGKKQLAQDMTAKVRAACQKDVVFKAILETGELGNRRLITEAAICVARAGADFVKSSTGTIPIGATPLAVDSILDAFDQLREESLFPGLKISGGIGSIEDCIAYIHLIRKRRPREWFTPQSFRVGSSKLLQDLMQK